RSLAVVPRPRHPRALSFLGAHAVGIRRRVRAHRAVAGDLPGPRHQPDRVRHQPAGRRGARPARSEAAHLSVLEVAGLKTYFFTRAGVLKAVDDVSFSLKRAE